MKKAMLVVLIGAAFSATAQTKPQSLKDLLYSGKLKSDSGTVIRRSDDLSTKIDTATRKPTEPVATKTATLPTAEVEPKVVMDVTPAAAPEATPPPVAVAPKSPTKVWKGYTDSLAIALKAEVLNSKKIKKGDYYLTVEYEQGTDGAVSVTNVTTDPENVVLQEAVKERINAAPPQLSPSASAGSPARKQKKKYSFTVTKE